MSTSKKEFDLSGNATRSTMAGIASFLGWLALGVLLLSTGAHAIFLAISWANLNTSGGSIFAILAIVGVGLVEVYAGLTSISFATHDIRAKQKPVAMMIEAAWVLFAAINLISSFSMQHGGEMPAFIGSWVTYGFPIAGLIMGVLYYIMKRLNPDAARAEDDAELRETFASIEHDAEIEVLNSEQMRAVIRQMKWQTIPQVIGRHLNLSQSQIDMLTRQAPQLLDLNRDGVPDIHESRRPSSGDMDLEDLVTYLVEERLRERPYSDNGHGQPARPTQRPDGR